MFKENLSAIDKIYTLVELVSSDETLYQVVPYKPIGLSEFASLDRPSIKLSNYGKSVKCNGTSVI